MAKREQRRTPEQPSGQPDPTLGRDVHLTLRAFAVFQSMLAATAADHARAAPIEVRLQLAEVAADLAQVGEDLNLLAALLDLPERVPTISPEAARAVAAAGRALRSEPA